MSRFQHALSWIQQRGKIKEVPIPENIDLSDEYIVNGMLDWLCRNDTDFNDPLVAPLLYHFMRPMTTKNKDRLLYRCMEEKLRMLSAPSYKNKKQRMVLLLHNIIKHGGGGELLLSLVSDRHQCCE
jgi:hypothetical protein